VKSFSEFFDEITEKDKVVSFAKEFQKNRSAKAKKEAVLFLKKMGRQVTNKAQTSYLKKKIGNWRETVNVFLSFQRNFYRPGNVFG
jgi:hypothetical protein